MKSLVNLQWVNRLTNQQLDQVVGALELPSEPASKVFYGQTPTGIYFGLNINKTEHIVRLSDFEICVFIPELINKKDDDGFHIDQTLTKNFTDIMSEIFGEEYKTALDYRTKAKEALMRHKENLLLQLDDINNSLERL